MNKGPVTWWEDLTWQTTPGTRLRGGGTDSSLPDVNTPCSRARLSGPSLGDDGCEGGSR